MLLRGVTHSVDEGETPAANLSSIREEMKAVELYPHLWSEGRGEAVASQWSGGAAVRYAGTSRHTR